MKKDKLKLLEAWIDMLLAREIEDGEDEILINADLLEQSAPGLLLEEALKNYKKIGWKINQIWW